MRTRTNAPSVVSRLPASLARVLNGTRHTPFAYGYIFGFADAVFIKEGVTADGERLGDIASLFQSLFGPKAGPMAFEYCVESMQEEMFVRGRLLGGQEIFDLTKSQGEQVPTALTTYLLEH